jgi:hypothetical protein
MKKAEKVAKKTITVCDKCLCASCWQGIFYCQHAWDKDAGTVEKTIEELRELGLESPDYWET